MLSIPEKAVFGADAKLHAITGKPIENGSGSLHPDAQAVGHLGLMIYELAELTQRRKDHADKLASETAARNLMAANHNDIAADDIVGRQGSVYRLAQQDTLVANGERQRVALAKEHEALTAKIAEVRAKLTDEGIIAKHGTAPMNTHLGMIRDKGWSMPA